MTTALRPERRIQTKIQRIIRPFEIKGFNLSDRTFEGFSAAYTQDLGDDIIYFGAFAKTITYWKTAGFSIPLMDHHRYQSIHDVLGSVTDAEEQENKGLWSQFEVDDGPEGDKLFRHIDHKRINGLSLGYIPVNPDLDKDGVRHLHEIQWKETSAVIWPMNQDATIDALSIKAITTDPETLISLSDDELKESLDALTAEATARHEKANPPIPQGEADKLRDSLLSLRLRPLLSRTSGQNTAHLTPTGKAHERERIDKEAAGASR